MTRNKKRNTEPLDAALSYLDSRAMTVREIEDRLDALNYAEYDVYQAVERLKELGYLNDEKFASDFIESRLASKPVSRRKLKEQLYTHKLPKDVISEALKAVTDEIEYANALANAKKYHAQFISLDEEERKLRTMRRILGRGYSFSDAKRAIEEVFGDASGLEDCTGEVETDDE